MNETKKPQETPELNEEQTWNGVEHYLATEVIEQGKRSAKAWRFVAILFFSLSVGLAVALVGTNLYWIYQYNSYDYVSQDGEGVNNINTGDQGDLLNGTESED